MHIAHRIQIYLVKNVLYLSRCQKMQRIRRLLLLAERYVSTIEATHPSNRSILPHAAMFRGRPLRIKIIYDTKKEEFTIEVHLAVKYRI
jgi:hypothetical protein